MAEARRNRTYRSRTSGPSGFEVQQAHQHPFASVPGSNYKEFTPFVNTNLQIEIKFSYPLIHLHKTIDSSKILPKISR